jgi:hypothetical protein
MEIDEEVVDVPLVLEVVRIVLVVRGVVVEPGFGANVVVGDDGDVVAGEVGEEVGDGKTPDGWHFLAEANSVRTSPKIGTSIYTTWVR